MKSVIRISNLLLLAICTFTSASVASAQVDKVKNGPVIIELFTSEGCSSCPPADLIFSEEIKRNGGKIAALSEHVSYWDYLGWKDPNSSKIFDKRQNSYVSRFDLKSSYTPQVVINGVSEAAGNDQKSIDRLLARELLKPPLLLPLSVSLTDANRVLSIKADVRGLTKANGEVHLAVTEDSVTSYVKAGENKGRKLRHDSVVRLFSAINSTTILGGTAEQKFRLEPGWNTANLSVVAFFQESDSGQITLSQIIRLRERLISSSNFTRKIEKN